MRWPSMVRCVALAAACLLTGCGAAQKSGPFAWAGFGRPKSPAVAERNPLREPPESTGEEADELDGSQVQAVAHLDAGDESGPNPETVALLERELGDASPQERAEFAGLAELPPDVVAQILRTRRLRMQQEKEPPAEDVQLAQNATHNPSTEPPPLQGVVAQPAPADPAGEYRILGGGGLGSANPWARENPAVLDPHLQPLDQSIGAALQSPARGHSAAYGSPDYGSATYGTAHGPGRAAPGGGAASEPRRPPAIASREGEFSPLGTDSPRALLNPPEEDQPLKAEDPALALDAFGPLPDPAAGDWDAELQRLIARAESRIATASPGSNEAERNEYIRWHVHLRLLYLIAGQQGRAIVAIPGIDPADQEFWMQTVWALNDYFDQSRLPDRSDRATQTVAQLRTAIRKLQEQARLELRNVTFCHKIASYGNYERFERDEFNPGQPVLLYAEVANFTSETTAEGQYRTVLQSTIEIYKAGREGDLVERLTFPATEDLCRNYRQDYFHSYEFTIPARIALGPHVLKLTVEDQLSRKLATYSVNFTVK